MSYIPLPNAQRGIDDYKKDGFQAGRDGTALSIVKGYPFRIHGLKHLEGHIYRYGNLSEIDDKVLVTRDFNVKG